MIKDVIQAEWDQAADCALIDDAVHLAEADMAALAQSQENHRHWSAIRDRTILTMRDVRRNILHRADEAKATLKELTESFFRANGIKAPPNYSTTLQDIPTTGLVHHLQYLIRTGELQRVQGIRDALENRLDRHSLVAVFEEILAQCLLSDSQSESRKRLVRICRLAKEADAKLTGLWFRHDRAESGNGMARDLAVAGQSSPAAVDGGDIPYRAFDRPIDPELCAPEASPRQEVDLIATRTLDHLESAA
ncbi:MAG TPA: hypothetical protein VH684_05205 [Xanthobacteraceae bacterium]|jgi:hypothetical protein